MTQLYQSVRGMNDIYGGESKKFSHIINAGIHIASRYNFEYLNTPIIEYSTLYERNLGDDSDVVSKELYRFNDKSGNQLALRPEFTAGIVRCIVENKLLSTGGVKKYFSYGPLFRYDRPQQGRYRQFNQLNFEIIGSGEVGYDVECLMAAINLLKAIKTEDYSIEINYIGNAQTRGNYKKALVEYLKKYKTSLSADSQKKLLSNPLRILDSKDQTDKTIVKEGPYIQDYYSHQDEVSFNNLNAILGSLGIEYNINPCLVRGLDYYDGMVFEIMQSTKNVKNGNAGLTLLGGGRYDGLIGQLSDYKQSAPAVGFALGIERLMALLDIGNVKEDSQLATIIYYSANEIGYAITVAERLRKINIRADIIHMDGNMKKKFQRAAKMESRYVVICGEDEKANNIIKVKDFNTNEEKVINTFEMENYFTNLFFKS